MPNNFEEITKHPEVAPIDVHPTTTAGQKFKGSDLPPFAGSDGFESDFVRCKQCGFPFKKRFHPQGSGWGNDNTQSITTIAGGTANAKDPISTAGCPLCSASEYE